jgi:hypothetical protein
MAQISRYVPKALPKLLTPTEVCREAAELEQDADGEPERSVEAADDTGDHDAGAEVHDAAGEDRDRANAEGHRDDDPGRRGAEQVGVGRRQQCQHDAEGAELQ